MSGYMQTRLSSNMQEPALLWHKSASELRQRERSPFDSKWARDGCQMHREHCVTPQRSGAIDQYGMSHTEGTIRYNSTCAKLRMELEENRWNVCRENIECLMSSSIF